MRYKLINDQSSIDNLMKNFNYFHDSCIKELKYVSGTYVNEDGAINPFNSIRTVKIIFQSQDAAVRTLEMRFENVVRLNLCPKDESKDSIIYGASIIAKNGLLYWSSLDEIELSKLENNDYTWISSEKISWRRLENCLGDNIIY